MSAVWWYLADGGEVGPLTFADLQALARSGQLRPDTAVRRSTDAQWLTALRVPGLFAPAGDPAKLPQAKALASAAPPRAAPPPPRRTAAPPVGGPPPVSAPPASSTPPFSAPPVGAPSGVPMGVPVGVAVPTGAAVAPPSPYAARPAASQPVADEEGSSNQALLIAGGVGVVLVLLVLGGFGAYFLGSSTPPVQVALEQENEPLDDDVPPLESLSPAAPAATAAPARVEPPSAEADPKLAALLASVTDWRDASPRLTITLRGAYRLKITGIWLSDDPRGARSIPLAGGAVAGGAGDAPSPATAAAPSDAADNVAAADDDDAADLTALLSQGRPAEPAAGAAADTPATDAPAAGPRGVGPRRYLFVEVQISNGGEQPLRYSGWNVARDSLAEQAVLLDERTRPLRLAPTNEAPGPGRLGAMQLSPGQSVTDVLAFELPAAHFARLRLLLPKTALERDGHYGFEITPDLLVQRGAPAAGGATAAAEAAADPVARAIVGDSPPAAVVVQPEAPAARPNDDDAPPDIRKLIEGN